MSYKISIKAIFFGFCTFLGGSFVYALIVGLLMAPFFAGKRYEFVIWIVHLIVAFLLIYRSGYVTACVAKSNQTSNAILVGLMVIIYSFVFINRVPLWFWLIYVLSMIPISLLGSRAYFKKRASSEVKV